MASARVGDIERAGDRDGERIGGCDSGRTFVNAAGLSSSMLSTVLPAPPSSAWLLRGSDSLRPRISGLCRERLARVGEANEGLGIFDWGCEDGAAAAVFAASGSASSLRPDNRGDVLRRFAGGESIVVFQGSREKLIFCVFICSRVSVSWLPSVSPLFVRNSSTVADISISRRCLRGVAPRIIRARPKMVIASTKAQDRRQTIVPTGRFAARTLRRRDAPDHVAGTSMQSVALWRMDHAMTYRCQLLVKKLILFGACRRWIHFLQYPRVGFVFFAVTAD